MQREAVPARAVSFRQQEVLVDQVQPDYDRWVSRLDYMRRIIETDVRRAQNAQEQQQWANLKPALHQARKDLELLRQVIASPPLGL